MAGAGTTTEGKVNGIDIYGWTTPVTIENMTNIPTHNLGGSGEDSSYITFRAGGTKVYIDRDITISETDSAIARIIDEDGNVFISYYSSGKTNLFYISGLAAVILAMTVFMWRIDVNKKKYARIYRFFFKD